MIGQKDVLDSHSNASSGSIQKWYLDFILSTIGIPFLVSRPFGSLELIGEGDGELLVFGVVVGAEVQCWRPVEWFRSAIIIESQTVFWVLSS